MVPRLLRFIEDLTNWYVKMNRKRLKGGAGVADAQASIKVLFGVLMTLVRCMAPFTPLFCELLYKNLRLLVPEAERVASVHFLPFPEPDLSLIDERMELKVPLLPPAPIPSALFPLLCFASFVILHEHRGRFACKPDTPTPTPLHHEAARWHLLQLRRGRLLRPLRQRRG